MEKLILRKKFKINFGNVLHQRNQKKDKLNIQELLKNSGVESMLDLNKLIEKIKKKFIESTLDAEFDEHMGYQKHDQHSRRLWFKSCSQLNSNIKWTNYIISR